VKNLTHDLPAWIDSGHRQMLLLNNQFKDSGVPISLDAIALQVNDRLRSQLQGLTSEAVSVAVFTVTSLLDFLLTIVFAFYLLQHGEQLWQSLLDWLPARMHQPLSRTLRLSFQNFFLGQMILATCMGVSLTILFVLLAVPYGLLFGLTIGAMALIPFGGTFGIALITLLMLLRDFTLGLKVLVASVIVQQILENLVAPRVLGKVTGLNPVWVFVSILTGARIGGLLGVIVAVPTAVVIKNALMVLRSPNGAWRTRPSSHPIPALVVADAAAQPAIDQSESANETSDARPETDPDSEY